MPTQLVHKYNFELKKNSSIKYEYYRNLQQGLLKRLNLEITKNRF